MQQNFNILKQKLLSVIMGLKNWKNNSSKKWKKSVFQVYKDASINNVGQNI